jgi:lactoylglutathione lyase
MRWARLILAMAMGMAVLASQSLRAAEPAPRLSYVALNVFDEKRALDFYVGVLGMTERRRVVPNPALTEILLGFTKDPSDPGVLLVIRGGRDRPYDVGDGYSRFILDVANLDKTVKRLTDAGVKLFRPVTEVKDLNLRYAMVKDPDGYLIEFVQPL